MAGFLQIMFTEDFFHYQNRSYDLRTNIDKDINQEVDQSVFSTQP